MGCTLCGCDVPVEETGGVPGRSPSRPEVDTAGCAGCASGVARGWVDDQVREDQLRRMAERQGLWLMASRSAEHTTTGCRLYWLTVIADPVGHQCHRILVSPVAGMTLDGVEEYLRYGSTRAEIMQYLIRSYGPLFVEELIKRLPRPRVLP